LPLVMRLVPALAVVFGIGLADDLLTVSPWIRLAAETGAAVLAWIGGIRISALDGYTFSGIAISFVVTILWIVTCTNAINLIDGVDGLATGVSLFAACTMLIAALLEHNYPMALAVVPLAGSLLGFLRYNFSPASIFLGDSGSLTLGFLVGCFGAVWAEKSTTLLGLTAPFMVLSIPLFDVALAIARRTLRGKSLFAADDAHIHHKLLSRGLTPRKLLFTIYGICALSATASILLTVNHNQNRDFVLVLVCLSAWLGLQQLGYSEFGIAKRLMFSGTIRSALSAQLALDTFEQDVNGDITLEESCNMLCKTCPQFGFSGMVFEVDEVKHAWGINDGWHARLDFPGHGYITVWRDTKSLSGSAASVLFIDSVSRVLVQKLNRLHFVSNE